MDWDYKGLNFKIRLTPMGPFFMASAQVPQEGPYVRVRPFSAIGRSEEEALRLVKEQIALEYRRLPEVVGP